MPMTTARWTSNPVKLNSVYDDHVTEMFNFGPGLTLARGTVLGVYTASANDVQTISDTPTITAGTFTISGINPLTGAAFTTAALDYNEAIADIEDELEVHFGAGNVAVTGGALPGTDVVVTFSGDLAGQPVPLMTIDSTDLTGGTLAIAHTTVGRSGAAAAAYVGGSATDPARAILPYDIVTDSSGRITLGDPSAAATAQKVEALACYVGGTFRVGDLTGLDAGAVTDLHGRIIAGKTDLTDDDALLQIPTAGR